MQWSRTIVSRLLESKALRLRKSMGQCFLVDENYLAALVRDAGVGAEDGVVEIGAGLGNLTDHLARRAGHVWAFEVDPQLHALARQILGDRPNVALIRGDGAEFADRVEPARCRRLRVVSNLPYRDWKRLLLALLSAPFGIETYTILVQRGVADRLLAPPGTREYGPMGALVQATCQVRRVRRAPRSLFFPLPRVDSLVLELRRAAAGMDGAAMEARLRALFAGRRKRSVAARGRRVEALAPRELLELVRRTDNP